MEKQSFYLYQAFKNLFKAKVLFVGKNVFDLSSAVQFQCVFKKIFINVVSDSVFLSSIYKALHSVIGLCIFWLHIWSSHL